MVVDNVDIEGSLSGFPPTSSGVRCEDGACARIGRDARISGRAGTVSVGLVITGIGTLVDRNVIDAGCGVAGGNGLLATDAAARIENNVITGSTCPPTSPPPGVSYGVRVLTRRGPREVDLHSNTIRSLGMEGPCTSRALGVEPSEHGSGTPRRGLVRNNVLEGGVCDKAFAVDESVDGHGPRVMMNNDLWAPVPYRVAGSRSVASMAEVQALPDLIARDNLSADPKTTADGLDPSSPCRNAGTSEGAPAVDARDRRRPAEERWDIGAYEYVP